MAAKGFGSNLLGQNVNGYRGLNHLGEIIDFAELMPYWRPSRVLIVFVIPLRILEFSDALIDIYAEVPALVDHLHLPVQSGSDRVLAAMKRNHTVLEYKSKIRRLRKIALIYPCLQILLWFSWRGDREFEETMNLIRDVNYDSSFSFIYSARPGTPAADLPDTAHEVKSSV